MRADDPLATVDIPHFCNESGHLAERGPDEGAPDRLRLVYNGRYQEQLRVYDLVASDPTGPNAGGAELLVLDGTFDVWHDPIWADVYAPAFRDDLVAGCGCDLVDEASTWVDGRPGKRFRLALPTPEGPALTDLWVVPVGEGNGGGRPQGIWLASWRVVDPVHDTRAMAPGRAMIALVRLSRLEELVAPAPAPEPAPEPADAQDAPS